MYIDCCRCKLRSVLEVMGTSAFSIVSIYVINKKKCMWGWRADLWSGHTPHPTIHPPTHKKKRKKRERFVYYDLLYLLEIIHIRHDEYMCVMISLLTQVTWQIALNDDDDCWGFQLPFSNFSEGIFWELNLG